MAFEKAGIVYFDLGDPTADTYEAVVRTTRPLPKGGAFWIDGPDQTESGHDRLRAKGKKGFCYVVYFYGEEQDPPGTPRIFPPAADHVTLGYQVDNRTHRQAKLKLRRSKDGLGGKDSAALAKRIGCP